MTIERKGKEPEGSEPEKNEPIDYYTVFGGPREDSCEPHDRSASDADHDLPAAPQTRAEPYGVRLAIGFAMLRGDD